MLEPLYRWIWSHPGRRARKLLSFAAVEADGGRDLVRAAEVTRDPLLRRLYLVHADDECHHSRLFRDRGVELLNNHTMDDGRSIYQADWLAPGERGLDDLHVEQERDGALLAFLHLSEKAAARSFANYRDALPDDPATRQVFEKVLRDEEFHMNYTRAQLTRIEPEKQGMLIWRARLARLWKGYLRSAMALAGLISAIVLTAVYFIIIPPFAVVAKRAARREADGWNLIHDGRGTPAAKQDEA